MHDPRSPPIEKTLLAGFWKQPTTSPCFQKLTYSNHNPKYSSSTDQWPFITDGDYMSTVFPPTKKEWCHLMVIKSCNSREVPIGGHQVVTYLASA
jgi:hypothetical protein